MFFYSKYPKGDSSNDIEKKASCLFESKVKIYLFEIKIGVRKIRKY